MKKIIYLFTAVLLLAACNEQKGYVITGTVEGGADGDTVFLQKVENRQLVKVDTATITNGEFTFKGAQDTAENRYITYNPTGKNALRMDFFLENGKINIQLTTDNDVATGTPNNDIYQEIRSQISELNKELMTVYQSMSEATDEERTAIAQKMNELQEKIMDITQTAIAQNITNPVGIHLLKGNYYYMGVEKLDPLISQITAEYDNDEVIIKIKENVEKMKLTSVGQPFTDFEMETPEGKAIKLSDYVGKGKVVLVDFWASWCGPCRREMPNLVAAYAKYKNKGFEIVGVSLDQSADAWKESIQKLNMTWPQMSDLKYWNCEGAQLYAISSIPHTLLIDGNGTIIARGLHGEGLQDKLAEIFN